MAKNPKKKRGSPTNIAIDASKQKEFNQKIQKVKEESKEGPSEPGVVYISHLPWGFEEGPLRDYFKQFGTIKKLRLSRSKKTGGSRGYAYIQFAQDDVAKIVSETMNNYLMFGKLIKCKHLQNPHPNTFKHANRKFIKPAAQQHAIEKHNSFKSESALERSQKKAAAKIKKLQQQLAARKINYQFDDAHFDVAMKRQWKLAAEKKKLEKERMKTRSTANVIDVDKDDSNKSSDEEEKRDIDSGVEDLSTKKAKGKKGKSDVTNKLESKGKRSVGDKIEEEEGKQVEDSDESSEEELDEDESEDIEELGDEEEEAEEDSDEKEDESSDEISSDEIEPVPKSDIRSKKSKGLKTLKMDKAKMKKLALEKSGKKTPKRQSLIPKEVDTPTGKMNVLIEDSSDEEIDFKTPPYTIKSSKLDDNMKAMQKTPSSTKTSPKRKLTEQSETVSGKKARITPGSDSKVKKGKEKTQSPKSKKSKTETVSKIEQWTPKGARFVGKAQSEKREQGNRQLKAPPSHKKRRSLLI